MHPPLFTRRKDGTIEVRVAWRGAELLSLGMLNRGTAFSVAERREFELEGLLPAHVSTLDEQVARAYANIRRKTDPLECYIGMTALLDRNETLFYRVLLDHVEDLMPIVYTPTVGEACKSFSHIFRRARGLWITPEHKGRIADILAHCNPGTRLIVVTDNERILGLGDQGAGGMGIPIGKLALYTIAAGIHPASCLPVSLDVGTDNEELLADPFYLGYRSRRLRGPEYEALVEEFIGAVRQHFPRALLQWEDFKKTNALRLLARYRSTLPSFNDDIQGTAAIGLAAVYATARATGVPLAGQRIVILGAGAAGVGIARQIRDALVREGVAGEHLKRALAVLDTGGLILEKPDADPFKKEFAWPVALAAAAGFDVAAPIDLLTVVRALKPTVLIGTSGQSGAFSEEIVRAMAASCEAPAIFPLSNPTSKSEATPADILAWTEGRALVATGSPFDAVDVGGKPRRISQGNNVYVFPGLGLGALVGGAREVTDSMFTVAARTLAESLDDESLADGLLFPPLVRLRSVTRAIAAAVIREINSLGIGDGLADDAIDGAIDAAMWDPQYPTLIPV